MTNNLISTIIRNTDPEFYISITFQCPKGLKDNIILHEIKFFKIKHNLLEHVNFNNYILIENPTKIQNKIINKSINLINEYLSGKKINLYEEFKLLNINLSMDEQFPKPFSYKVIQSLLKLGYGEITSYSQLANTIGSKAYRAIGSVLKKNPYPLLIPCHRVIKKSGQIGGFMGTMNSGWEVDLKGHLINLESIHDN